jgi:hypothetical protein
MTDFSKGRTGSPANLFFILLIVAVVFSMAGCPSPLSEIMVLRAKDVLGPIISVTSPAAGGTYRGMVGVTGTVTDPVLEAGDRAGKVISLQYEVLLTSLTGEVEIGEEGTFYFQFSAAGLSGDQRVKLTATDWKGNNSEYVLELTQSVEEPYIEITTPVEGSAYGATVLVEGRVSNSIEESGSITEVKALSYQVLGSSLGGEIDFDTQGAFSFSFPTSGLSGNIVVRLTGEDYNTNTTTFDLNLLYTGSQISGFSSDPGDGNVTLTWDNTLYSLGYTLYYTDNGALPSESYGTQITGVTSPYTLTNCTNGRIYSFRLRSSSSTGDDNWSSVIQAVPLTEVYLTPKVTGEYNSIRVEWSPIKTTDEYVILRAGSADGNYINISGPVEGTSFTDTAVSVDTVYYYKVRPALDGSISSLPSTGKMHPFPAPWEARIGSVNTPGTALALHLNGSYAYVADKYSGLHIIDISNPHSPVLIGSCDTPGEAVDVTVSGSYAYVADYNKGLQIIDIGTASSPSIVGADSSFYAHGIDLDWPYAYIGANTAGLRVFNVENPNSPSQIGLCDTAGTAKGVMFRNDYVYVADDMSGLAVVDVGTPTTPIIADTVNTTGQALTVRLSGNHAYVADASSGLAIIDVEVPTDISVAGTCKPPNLAQSAVADTKYAFVADYSDDLRIVNIEDPANPETTWTIDLPGDANGVEYDGTYVYTASRNNGLYIIDPVNPADFELKGSAPTSHWAQKVAVYGDYVCVADGIDGITVMDVSNPGTPGIFGTNDTGGTSLDIFVSGSYAYLLLASSGLLIFDLSDPSSPELLGSYGATDSRSVYVRGNLAFVTINNNGLEIIDVGNPANPQSIAICDMDGRARGVTVKGDYAYVTGADSSNNSVIRVVDISNPASPIVRGTASTGSASGNAGAVCIRDNYAYFADGDDGIQIADIGNPSAPSIIGTYDTAGAAVDVALFGSFLFVADLNGGLHLFDVSDPETPETPVFVKTYNPAADVYGVAVSGRYAYVGNFDSGLHVLELWNNE